MKINFKLILPVLISVTVAACFKNLPPTQSERQSTVAEQRSAAPSPLTAESDALAQVGSVPISTSSSLEEMLIGFPSCKFDGVHIDTFTGKPANSYFLDRALEPCRIDKETDSAYFCVKDLFYGLPVYEIEIPAATAGFAHALYFDVSAAEAARVLKKKLGSDFRKSKKSEQGEAPELLPDPDNGRRSLLMCTSIAA